MNEDCRSRVSRPRSRRDIRLDFKDSPSAAAELVRRIQLRINRLAVAGLSHMGRPGLVDGTRELLETPYIIVYSVDEAAGAIEVIAIVHGARDRQA
ncbi:type II toxin-antitoxin system RelE/ParE family toxin [Bradyrhizobium algeriense]|uniref:type II toxin-antitoxin system RelE/ParE family toxin n=1 Tax=Bradyrhizobium algeriense TaxID=634784 RepID=UPI000D394EB9